jgi:molecular chaperone GrpE
MHKRNHSHGNTAPQEEKTAGEKTNGEVKAQEEETAKTSSENCAESSAEDQAEQKSSAPGNEAPDWPQKAAELESKLADLNDQYLRKAADFENFRKRMVREKQELTEFANQSLLLDLLPVIDDFERAIKSAETGSAVQNSKEYAGFLEGIKLIEKGLSTMLDNKWGLKRFDSEGEIFDPNRHEAIQMEKSAEISEAVVKDDYLKGYLLKDRVIRFAKVKVLVPENVTEK